MPLARRRRSDAGRSFVVFVCFVVLIILLRPAVSLPLRGAKAIDTLYDEGLAKLPKAQHQEKFVRRYHERYHWPLAAAIVLLLVEFLFPERKRESRPRPAAAEKPLATAVP